MKYAEFSGNVHFPCFRPETPFLGKLDPKIQFGTYIILNMLNLMVFPLFSFYAGNTLFGQI